MSESLEGEGKLVHLLFTDPKPGHGGSELLAGLMRLGDELRSATRLQEVVRAIASTTVEAFGFNETTVYLYEVEHDWFRAHAVVGRHPEIDAKILETPVPADLFKRLLIERFQVGVAYFIDHRDYTWSPEDAAYFPSPDLGPAEEGRWHTDDALFVPLYDREGALIGVLDLFDPQDRSLPTLDRIKPLEVFATHAAVAVVNAKQYEELERATRQVEQQLEVRRDLYDLSEVLLSTLDQRVVFERITEMLKTLVGYDTMDIRLVDEEAGELVAIYARDANADEMMNFRIPIDQGVTGWVVRHNQAQLVNDMNADPRVVQVPGTPAGEPQASMVVPLQVMGRVSGVLSLDRLGGRTFNEFELELARLFANQAAIAIQNARSYKEMELQAISDGLTGIHNYRHFQESLAAEVSRADRYGEVFCLLMMDLDHFKSVNDTVGHQRGDEVLRAVAAVLRRCSRESDYLARYGGEEFTVILPRTALTEACAVAQRICDQVREIDAGAAGVRVSMSIGVAAFPESARDKDDLLGAADAALMRAKALGRDRVCTFGKPEPAVAADGHQAAMGRAFMERLRLSEDEASGLAAALRVLQAQGSLGHDVRSALGGETERLAPEKRRGCIVSLPRRSAAFEALLYAGERWDGGGYPEGLRGESIPRVARAFAVLRDYVAEGADEAACVRLRAKAGKALDPRFVDRFCSLLKDGEVAWAVGVADEASGGRGELVELL